MINVIDSTKFVFDQLKEIKINRAEILSLSSRVKKEDLQISEIELSNKNFDLNTNIQIIFIFNTINFCFWAGKGEEKWTVDVGNEKLDGAIALFRCIEKEVERNIDFICGDELSDLSGFYLKKILRGNVQISLFEERLKCLNEAGKVIEKYFGNSFLGLYKKAENDAIKLVNLLVENFPCFDDTSEYKGKKIGFYKRAQLNSKMISDALVANKENGLKNLDKLTAFADYKIPQILRNLGIFNYSTKLSNKVDSYELINKGFEEEIEIRSATIWAVELIKQELQKKYDFVTASHIDSMLWKMSQTKSKGDKPYHRTLTTAY